MDHARVPGKNVTMHEPSIIRLTLTWTNRPPTSASGWLVLISQLQMLLCSRDTFKRRMTARFGFD